MQWDLNIFLTCIDFQPFWQMVSMKIIPLGIKKFGKNLRPFIFALPKQGV
jgi:hypothetical protein